MKQLQERAVLVRLHLGLWQARTFDRDATSRVTEEAGAAAKAARVTKRLIGREWLRQLERTTDAVRAHHYKATLPWNDKGDRLLPAIAVDKYRREMDTLLEARQGATAAFLAVFDAAIEDAKADLGGLFNPDDYPAAADIAKRVTGWYEFTPVPEGKHFIANIGEDEVAAIRSQITQMTHLRIAGAVTDLYQRIHDAVDRLAGQLVDTEGRSRPVHQSVLENLAATLTAAHDLNITEDAALNDLVAKTEAVIAGVTVEQLRPREKAFDPAVRATTAAKLEALKGQFAGYIGDVA